MTSKVKLHLEHLQQINDQHLGTFYLHGYTRDMRWTVILHIFTVYY